MNPAQLSSSDDDAIELEADALEPLRVVPPPVPTPSRGRGATERTLMSAGAVASTSQPPAAPVPVSGSRPCAALPSSARSELAPGRVIAGHYRLERRVGSGGMGEVWAAEHLTIHMRVAIKILLERARLVPEIVSRFEREAVLLGRTHSDYVPRVLDFIYDETFGPVLVTEFVEGAPLADVLQSPLTVEQAIELGIDLAAGIAELHRAHVVHRDIKPSNVIVCPLIDGRTRAVIIDLGVSHIVREEGDVAGPDDLAAITTNDMVVGTLDYMPPEQILHCGDVTPAADLYALGALLFRAVMGHNVFVGLDRVELVQAKLTKDAPPLDVGREDALAKGLAAVVARALQRSPSKRYRAAEEIADALRRVREGRSPEPEGGSEPPPASSSSRPLASGSATGGTKATSCEAPESTPPSSPSSEPASSTDGEAVSSDPAPRALPARTGIVGAAFAAARGVSRRVLTAMMFAALALAAVASERATRDDENANEAPPGPNAAVAASDLN